MTTPLIMLGLLVGPVLLLGRLTGPRAAGPLDRQTRAAIGVSAMFVFTGVGHFIETESMAGMLPAWVPARIALVYASGIVEITAAVVVLVPGLRRPVGWFLITMLAGFLPVNVYAAFVEAPMGGHAWGPIYLLIRVPLQLFIAAWIWWFLLAGDGNKATLGR